MKKGEWMPALHINVLPDAEGGPRFRYYNPAEDQDVELNPDVFERIRKLLAEPVAEGVHYIPEPPQGFGDDGFLEPGPGVNDVDMDAYSLRDLRLSCLREANKTAKLGLSADVYQTAARYAAWLMTGKVEEVVSSVPFRQRIVALLEEEIRAERADVELLRHELSEAFGEFEDKHWPKPGPPPVATGATE